MTSQQSLLLSLDLPSLDEYPGLWAVEEDGEETYLHFFGMDHHKRTGYKRSWQIEWNVLRNRWVFADSGNDVTTDQVLICVLNDSRHA